MPDDKQTGKEVFIGALQIWLVAIAIGLALMFVAHFLLNYLIG